MSAGALRTPVTLEQPVRTTAADGTATLVYHAAGTTFADIKPVRQREERSGGRLTGLVNHEIRLRYREDLSGGWRLSTPRHRFRILSVQEDISHRRTITCLAEEETS